MPLSRMGTWNWLLWGLVVLCLWVLYDFRTHAHHANFNHERWTWERTREVLPFLAVMTWTSACFLIAASRGRGLGRFFAVLLILLLLTAAAVNGYLFFADLLGYAIE